MKLNKFLKLKKISIADLARDLSLTHCTARLWVCGERIPRVENMRKIYEWSGGKVRPEDFYLTDSDSEKEEKENG